ncbi:TMEM175 family protein [Dellaglioa sp. P0083]|uniref:TMEM175 family protein n=1 Tax=Dellaglioa kimchii TaxID=3344667 RepID=UPI0038D3FEA6
MSKGRVEAFTDAVVAIIMTIMVLELKAPEGDTFSDLIPLQSTFLAYVLSFFLIGVTWNNHHHMFQLADKINGRVLIVNTGFMFVMSFMPFATSWVGEHYNKFAPAFLYGLVFLLFNIMYVVLTNELLRANGPESNLAKAIKNDNKTWVSLSFSLIGLMSVFIKPELVLIFCLIVPSIWFIPNRLIENFYKDK